MLILIGLGLGGPEDMTIQGQNLAKTCSSVFIDAYTSLFCSDLATGTDDSVSVAQTIRLLETSLDCTVKPAYREDVEQAEQILSEAISGNVAFLVVGDPLGATTHIDLILRCIEREIPYRVVHNTSILTAVGCCGLQLYRFGETISIPFWSEVHKPESFLDRLIDSNLTRKMHSLCLLDIRVREPTLRALMRGLTGEFEPPQYMHCHQAAALLLQLNQVRRDRRHTGDEGNSSSCRCLPEDLLCVGLARVGTVSQRIAVTSIGDMATNAVIQQYLGGPLHCLAICGELHDLETDMLQHWWKSHQSTKSEFAILLRNHNKALEIYANA